MTCKDIERLLYLVREGELTPEEEKQVAAHLATCWKCREIHESVTRMTRMTRQADYVHKPVDFETIHMPGSKPSRFLVVKGMAAAILVLIGFSFFREEIAFYRNRSALEVRFQSAENNPAAGKRDCVSELKKRYRVTNLMAEAKSKNLISEEELVAYVQQACASDADDMNQLENLLMQAGLIKSNNKSNK